MKRILVFFIFLALMSRAEMPERMDLFLLIGQSNMAGRGLVEPDDQVPHPRIFMLRHDLTWVPAIDPMHYDKPTIAGVGPGLSFARVIVNGHLHQVLGLIPAAMGGSSLDEWAPGGKLYSEAVSRAKKAMEQGRLVGILWHQGESDSVPEKAATYAARFATMISQLRTDLSSLDVPVIVGETGRFRADATAINDALATLPGHVPHCSFVSSEGLTDKGDKLHFDSASQRKLGRRYAEAWLAQVSKP